MVGLENFELAGIKSYTRFWGLLMFGSYSVINVIVLLNLLIAMMSNSYAMIDEHSDVEWKFARTRLWMSYFEESATLPPPFNILPTPKLLLKFLGLREKDKVRKMKLKENIEKENDVCYTAVMRALVWRYVSAMHRRMDDEPVTEDDINELKGDVSALRYELLEVFERNGMDVSFTDKKEKTVLGKRMKVWERRLMKDFHVAPVAGVDEAAPEEGGLAKFRRLAKMAVATTSNAKWDQTLAQAGISSQIGRCRSRESFKNQQNLQRAMDEARKLVLRSPLPEGSRGASPIQMPLTPGHTLLELIKDISTEVGEAGPPLPQPKSPWKPGEGTSTSPTVGGLLSAMDPRSRPVSPKPGTPGPAQVSPTSKGPSPIGSPRGPSPRPVSPVTEETTQQACEPSPLKAKRVPGDTPPKVIKRKPPAPPSGEEGSDAAADDSKAPEDIVVARPVAPEIKPAEGAIPPPPAVIKPKAPTAPTMEVTPSTPPTSPLEVVKPKSPSPTPSKPPSRTPSPTPSKPPSPPKETKPPSPPEKVPSRPTTPVPSAPSPTSVLPPPAEPSKSRPASPVPTTSVLPKPPSPPPKPVTPIPATIIMPPTEKLPFSRATTPLPESTSTIPKTPVRFKKQRMTRSTSPILKPASEALPRTPSPPPQRLSSTSSTEQLIPPSPEPLRPPAKKLDDIKTIKRQPKTGWL